MSRQQKWDWSSHLLTMRDLYHRGWSIPDISKAIQCEGFEPCQRSVYKKFQDMGYPTHPVDRAARLFDPDFPSYKQDDFENIFGTLDGSQSPNIPTNEHMRSGLCPLPEGNMLVDSTYSWPHLCEVGSPAMGQSLEGTPVSRKMLARESQSESESVCRSGPKITSAHFDQLCSLWSSSTASTSSQSWSLPSSAFDHSCEFPASSMELNGAAYFNMSNSSNELNITASGNTGEHTHLGLNYLDFGLNGVAAAGHGPSPLCASMDLDHDPMSPHDTTGQFQQTSRPNETKMPFPHSSNASSAAGTRTKLRSFFRPRSSGFSRGKKRYPTSEYTFNTEDSGYASGFTSCLSLPDIQQEDPQSLSEFNGLYRVACQNLHEPQGMAKFRDIPTCKYCRYSSILNLGWSSRYLKFEVFLSELRLEGVYEFGALDAAGNTALHYAAAGGGSFLHLKALIDAGVDPYAANTAGELFIYCLRPLQPFTLELNPDCLKGNDLINLLKLLQPERVVGWRDNNGQTIFHALALKVTDPELKAKIFSLFDDAGNRSAVLDRFGRTPHDIVPLHYDCHGQVIDAVPANSFHKTKESARVSGEMKTREGSGFADWRLRNVKQIKSQEVVHQARRHPAYVDAETGDNALHALSKLKASNDILLQLEHFSSRDTRVDLHKREGHQILLNLEYFLSKGIDLNLHNRDGSHPLKSYICDRPPEENETGATISKYLDTLLWKDCSGRVSNDINVNMKDREGAIALHNAAARGRPDAVRSLIAAGANVNARSDAGLSVLQAAFDALEAAAHANDGAVLVHLIKEVVSHLEHAGAVQSPTSLQERGVMKL